jgi:adenine deaminase
MTGRRISTAHNLCFVTVVERHGKSAAMSPMACSQDFGLKSGAVASSVGHDSHNIIIAGTNEADMRVALDMRSKRAGRRLRRQDGKVTAMVPLPIAGLLSDKRVHRGGRGGEGAESGMGAAGCTIPYMGFNLIPLSVIPEIRITDKGLVLVPEMRAGAAVRERLSAFRHDEAEPKRSWAPPRSERPRRGIAALTLAMARGA